MNNVSLIGRLTKKPELRATPNDKYVCEFTIAITRVGTDITDFITIQVWGKQAENLCKYQDKGSQVAITGSVRVDQYETAEGEKRYKHYILANSIEYLGAKKEEKPAEQTDDFNPNECQVLTDDDLPF